LRVDIIDKNALVLNHPTTKITKIL
jgi:hypothetical protein